jgi:serine/threonine-protein kinase
MEYLDGQPFNRILSATSFGMPLGMHLSVIAEALNGLHYAHELKDYDGTPLNMVHRDVTPHNIFVTYTGQVKVMDFGIAKAAGRIAETRFGVIKGKVGYMAPEQVALKPLDRRADVYAAGVVIYEAATRRRMWQGVPQQEVLTLLIHGKHPKSPRERRPDVHEELDRICRKALANDPGDRYPTAAALQEDLEAFIADHDKRPSPRQLGNFVSSRFAEQQEHARKVIQDQLTDILSSRRSVVNIEVADEDTDQVGTVGTASMNRPRETPSAPIESDALATSNTKISAADSMRSPRRLYALIGVAVAALGVAVGGVCVMSQPDAGSTQVAAPTGDITLRLRATPPEARFRLDDGPPLDNPYVARIQRDDKVHHLRVEAPGFVAETEDTRFDQDVSFRFALAPAPTPAPGK